MDEAKREEYLYWYKRALNILTRREHSIIELRQKLVTRDCPEGFADKIIEDFLERNYLSLERFAYSYAKNRADLGYGPVRTRYELERHEVPSSAIEEAFVEIDWRAARAKAERRVRQQDPLKRKEALYRRGFPLDEL